MTKEYRMRCEECDVISQESVGASGRGIYTDGCDTLVAFVKKHWLCARSIRIVDCDTWMSFDCRMDDCKPETVPYWNYLIRFTGEANERWEAEWKRRFNSQDMKEQEVANG